MTHRKLIISMSLLAALSAVALQPVVAAPSADDVVAKHDTDNDKALDAQEVAGVVGPRTSKPPIPIMTARCPRMSSIPIATQHCVASSIKAA